MRWLKRLDKLNDITYTLVIFGGTLSLGMYVFKDGALKWGVVGGIGLIIGSMYLFTSPIRRVDNYITDKKGR